MTDFSTRLEQLCYKSGRRRKDIAATLYISPSCLSLYCSGRSEPSLDTLCRIADTFGVTTDYMLGREKKK